MAINSEQINPLEFCRGYISALSYDGPSSAKAVHILSLRKKFKEAGLLTELGKSLTDMSLVGEVQHIGNGYWYPTPLRRVTIHNKRAILLSSNPTHQLIGCFPSLRSSDGLARVSRPEDVEPVPEQSINNWMGANTQHDTFTWAKSVLQKSKKEISPTIEPTDIQFLCFHNKRYFWGDKVQNALIMDNLVLFRRDRRFFTGRLRAGKIIGESNAISDGIRFQFGLAKLSGHPFPVSIKNEQGLYKISMAQIPLPTPEWRVIASLCKVLSFGVYLLSDKLSAAVIGDMFQRLGCDLR